MEILPERLQPADAQAHLQDLWLRSLAGLHLQPGMNLRAVGADIGRPTFRELASGDGRPGRQRAFFGNRISRSPAGEQGFALGVVPQAWGGVVLSCSPRRSRIPSRRYRSFRSANVRRGGELPGGRVQGGNRGRKQLDFLPLPSLPGRGANYTVIDSAVTVPSTSGSTELVHLADSTAQTTSSAHGSQPASSSTST